MWALNSYLDASITGLILKYTRVFPMTSVKKLVVFSSLEIQVLNIQAPTTLGLPKDLSVYF